MDEAARDFSVLVKQGGVDLTLTLATAGASKIGAISKAGGEMVGLVEDGMKATTAKLGKWNEEIVAGLRATFGEDLVYETKTVATKPGLLEDANLYSKSADELEKSGLCQRRSIRKNLFRTVRRY